METIASPSSSTTSLFYSSNKANNLNSKTLFSNLYKTKKTKSYPFFKSVKGIQSPEPASKNPTLSSFSRGALTFSPSETADILPRKLHHLITEFQSLTEPIDRVKRLLDYSTLLPSLPDSSRVDSNRVMGCTAQVWLEATLDKDDKMRFRADSDSEIARGFCYCLVSVFDGAAPEEVLRVKTEDLAALNVGLLGGERSRVNTWHNVLISMQKRTKLLVAEREGKALFEPFPSLVVTKDGVQAKGSYAEAQVSIFVSSILLNIVV